MNTKSIVFLLLCASYARNVSSGVPFETVARRFDQRVKILRDVLQAADADGSKSVEPVTRLIVGLSGPERQMFLDGLLMRMDMEPMPHSFISGMPS